MVEAFWTPSPTPRSSRWASTAPSARRRCAPTSRSSPGSRPSSSRPTERGPAERLRRIRRDPGVDGEDLRGFAEAGWVNFVGGCCGTNPAHIRAIASAVRGLPRARSRPSSASPACPASNRSRSAPTRNFIVVGERTNVTGSPRFAKLVASGDYEAALGVARQQVEGGRTSSTSAWTRGCSTRSPRMRRFLNLLSATLTSRGSRSWSTAPLGGDRDRPDVPAGKVRRQLDQPEGRRGPFPRTGSDGAAARRGRGRHGVRRGGAGGDGRPEGGGLPPRVPHPRRRGGFPRRTSSSTRTSDRRDRHRGARRLRLAYFEATRRIKAEMPHAKVSGGVSNVSFSFRGNAPCARRCTRPSSTTPSPPG